MPEESSLSLSNPLVVLLLGSPVPLILWALYRMRMAALGTTAAGTKPQAHTADKSMGGAFVLANYAAAVQASNLRQGKAFPLVPFLVMFELVQLYTAVYLLVVWRSVSYWIGWTLLAGFALLLYRFVVPRLQRKAYSQPLIQAHEAMPAPLQSAWGLLGHTLLWGSFCLIFVCIILREYYL